MMMKTLLITISLSFCLFADGQSDPSIKEDLKKMNLLYGTATSYSMSVKVDALKAGGNETFFTEKGQVKVSGKKHLISYNNITTIINDKYYLNVDGNRKIVIINKAEKLKKGHKADIDIAKVVDEFLASDASKMSYLKKNKEDIQIKIKADNSYYEKVIITISAKDHHLKQVVYYLNTTSDLPYDRIRIAYSKVSVNTKIPNNDFSIKPYVKTTGNTITLTGHYAAYELIDQTTIKL